ncbi:helix-turn-helix domain-containing protein, partial [Nonomuraea sp. NPDC055795]
MPCRAWYSHAPFEIAKIAQVSVATVSRVSRGTGQVSPEMRERVL